MMKNNVFAGVLLLGGIALWGWSCQLGNDKDQPPTPDVSGIQVKARIERFDRDLFQMDTANFLPAVKVLSEKYPAFLTFFTTQVAHDITNRDEKPEEALYGFVTAPQVRRLYDTCQIVLGDLQPFQKDLTQMLKYYKHYYPDRPEPVTVAAVTEFIGDAYMVNDTLMMLGLDMFLGPGFSGYNPELFPAYISRQFKPENMVLKYAFTLANNAVPPVAADRILDHIVRNGKVLYVLDCLLPQVADSTKINYTADQWAGSLANEQEVWSRLLDMKVLYEPLGSRNMKIVTESPSTDNVFQEAPGQIGNFIGWQIVKSYMKRFPDTTFRQLGELRDAQQFMEKAKYKPRKR